MDQVWKLSNSARSSFFKAFKSVYDSLCTRNMYGTSHTSLQKSTTWLNFGWWEFDEREELQEDKFAIAAQKLASKVASLARLDKTSGDEVVMLDAGCGCGDPAIHWARNNPNLRIEAVTLEIKQAKMAEARVKKELMADRIQVCCGDALEYLSRRMGCLDLVVSLDAAYHFQTRFDFIKLSFERLNPGGILVCTDICSGRKPHWLILWIICKAFSIPLNNLVTPHQLQLQLETTGFINSDIQNVDQEVWVGFSEFTRSLPWSLLHYKLFGYFIDILISYDVLHYVYWTATKP